MSEYADVQFGEGDEFALSPRGASRIISSILAAGGEFELDGNVVRITHLPAKSVDIKMEVPPVASPEPAPEPEPASGPAPEPEPVVEAPTPDPEKPTKVSRKPAAADEKK